MSPERLLYVHFMSCVYGFNAVTDELVCSFRSKFLPVFFSCIYLFSNLFLGFLVDIFGYVSRVVGIISPQTQHVNRTQSRRLEDVLGVNLCPVSPGWLYIQNIEILIYWHQSILSPRLRFCEEELFFFERQMDWRIVSFLVVVRE